jgi:putative oxygen-independent coproporphyrinogen III oxidase
MTSTMGHGTATRPNAGFGVYVHFPWCLSKCGYCDFYSVATRDATAIAHDAYADAIIAELERRLELVTLPELTTLYFGGGTPSLWRCDAMARVIRAILSACSSRAADVEITVECNPSSFDRTLADGLLLAGVNRISLGIQSLDPAQLSFLGRRHDRERAIAALDTAIDSGVPRVSADMLFGLPQQPLEAELAHIVEVAERPLSHVSAYALTIEQDTPFGRLARQGRLPMALDDRVAEAFVAVDTALERLGYEHYEISNFARPGRRSLHNLQYWLGLPYLGLGVAAFGTVRLKHQWLRYRNPANIERYLALPFHDPRLEVFQSAPEGALEQLELLDPETRFRERLLLGLRLREGVDLEAAGHELGVEAFTLERRRAIERLVATGRLTLTGTRLRIARSAWLLADGTIAELM